MCKDTLDDLVAPNNVTPSIPQSFFTSLGPRYGLASVFGHMHGIYRFIVRLNAGHYPFRRRFVFPDFQLFFPFMNLSLVITVFSRIAHTM